MKRQTTEETIQQMKDLVQPQVPDPVIAVGVLQPAGTWGSMALTKFSPALATLKRHRANQKAGGLAKSGVFRFRTALIAITADRVFAMEGKVKGRSWDVSEPSGSWERSDLRVTTKPGKLATRVTLDVTSTGDHYELEATTVMDNGFTSAFLTELTATAP